MNNKYTIIKQESIEELNGTGYILKHDKTGARVVVISNEDDIPDRIPYTTKR